MSDLQLQNGDTTLDGGQRYVYTEGRWLPLGKTFSITGTEEQSPFIIPRPGTIAEIGPADSDKQPYLYTGSAWLPATDLGRRSEFPNDAKDGTVVKINRDAVTRFYVDGEWHDAVRGGDAGSITLNIGKIHVSGDSKITTVALSSGGGKIAINRNRLVFLQGGEISASVQDGSGNGGSLSMDSRYLLQHYGPVTAEAIEGDGGEIKISGKVYQYHPLEKSRISAASESGKSGTVAVNSPTTNSGVDSSLPAPQLIQTQDLQTKPCTPAEGTHISRFTTNRCRGGVPVRGRGDLLAPLGGTIPKGGRIDDQGPFEK